MLAMPMGEGTPARGTVEVLSCSMTRTPPGKTRTKMEECLPGGQWRSSHAL